MNIRHLETFLMIANCKSFSKAAKQLDYSQAAVTIQIQQLEEELGTPLFERFNKSIALSEKGKLFYTHANEILQAVHLAKTAVCDSCEIAGELRIGTIESLCSSIFPDLISTYHKTYPNVHITITTGSPNTLLTMLDHNQVDLVYLMDEHHYDPNWINVMEAKEDIVFVCAPHHPLVKKADITIDDILQAELVLTECNASYRAAFQAYLIKHKKILQPCLEIGNTDFIIKMIESQFGVSLLPYVAVAPYLEQGRLAILKPQDITLEIWCQLLYHKHKLLTSQMQAFLQLVTSK